MTKNQGQPNTNAHYQTSNQSNINRQQVNNQNFYQGTNQVGFQGQNNPQVQTNSPVKV